MRMNCIRVLTTRIAGAIAVSVCVALGMIQSSSAEYPTAEETIRGALVNVRQRYRNRLDYYGWTELYYGETRGVCNLQLNMPGVAAPLAILYFRSDDTIQYPQIMPKGLAQQLIADRMLIDMYQKSLNASKASDNGYSRRTSQGTDSTRMENNARRTRRKRSAYKPLHSDEGYKPSNEELECDRESARLVREQKKIFGRGDAEGIGFCFLKIAEWCMSV